MAGQIRTEPLWLSFETVKQAQAKTIAKHGGVAGIRNPDLIQSALARAQQRYHYGGEDMTLFDLAAAYGWGLARNHGFIDGNKRVAALALYVFLGLNGLRLDAREADFRDIILAVAAGDLEEPALARWLAANCYSLEE